MFSRLQLSCRVTPSDRSQPVYSAWTQKNRCATCNQLRALDKQSGIKLCDKESISSLSSPTLLESPLGVLPCEALDLSFVSQPHQSSVSSLSLCRILSSPLCQSYSLCPFPYGTYLTSDSSSLSSLSLDSLLEPVEGLTSDFRDCSSLSSGCLPLCSDSPFLSSSLSSLSLVSSTSSSELSEEGVDHLVPTRTALSVTTTTIPTTRLRHDVGPSACTLVFSRLSVSDFAAFLDTRSSVSVGKSIRNGQHCGTTTLSLFGDVVLKASFLHTDELRGPTNFDFSVRAPSPEFWLNTPPTTLYRGSLSSPRGDSDSDAQIDSMSSSDLEQCEDLQSFELAHHHPVPDVQPFNLCDGRLQAEPHKDTVGNSSLQPSVNGHHRHMMSFREFEQLPPLPEDCAELPAMWEDGGSLAIGSARDGFGSGGGIADEGQWSTLTESSVQIFANDVDGSSNVHTSADTLTTSLEQRNTLIEQTLSEIYESPFPQLIYANSQSLSTKHIPRQQQQQQRHRKTASFKTLTDSEEASLSPIRAPKDNVDGNENSVGDNDSDNEQGETVSDEEEVGKTDGTGMIRLGTDTHGSIKASIARAAQKAVSGYRTCDDADSYVGARVKPTLILARAPPSPSGILRRTNKKASAKVVHGSVRWADGRAPSFPPSDDTTT